MQGIASHTPILVGIGLDTNVNRATQGSIATQQYIVSPLGVACISYGAVNSSLAIANIKREADQYFREQANELLSAWKDFKQELYSITDPVREDDLDAFYSKLYEVLPQDKQVEFDSMVAESGFESFDDLPVSRKLKISSELALPNKENRTDYQKLAFDQLDSNVQDRLVDSLLKEYGDDSFYNKYPYILNVIVRGVVQKRSKQHAKELEKEGLKFLGCGSIGAAFLCEHKGHKVVMKLGLASDTNEAAGTIKRDAEEIIKIRQNSILVAQDDEPSYGPEINFFPALVYDDDGSYLGSDEVLVTRFYDGDAIHDTDPDHNDKDIRICPQEYIERGLDDQFLDEFIQAYVRHASRGSDLYDLRVYNMFYKDGRLQFFETTGFDDEGTQQVNQFREDHSVAALLQTLLADILLFERTNDPVTKSIVERSVEKYSSGQTGAKEFWDSRYKQLEQSLERAIDAGIFSKDELKQGIQDLRQNTKYGAEIHNFRNFFTEQGLEYLTRLEKL